MIIKAKNNRNVLLQKLLPDDIAKLCDYLQHLGPDTVKRFGSHPFDEQSVTELYQSTVNYPGLYSQGY